MDISKIKNFFKHNGVTVICPCCSGDQWDYVDFKDGKECVIPAMSIASATTINETMPIVIVICQKCRYIRLHALKPIIDFGKQNNPEA